jgi:hypothetical protein
VGKEYEATMQGVLVDLIEQIESLIAAENWIFLDTVVKTVADLPTCPRPEHVLTSSERLLDGVKNCRLGSSWKRSHATISQKKVCQPKSFFADCKRACLLFHYPELKTRSSYLALALFMPKAQ